MFNQTSSSFSVFPGWNLHASQEFFSEGSGGIPTTNFLQFFFFPSNKIQFLVAVALRSQLCYLLPQISQLSRAAHFLQQESSSILKEAGGSGTLFKLPVSDFLFCCQLRKQTNKNFDACKGLIWLEQAYPEAFSLLRPTLPHDLR